MLLYLLRHGAAEAAAKSGRDADRALTDEGREKVRRVIRRAREGGLWPALILSSPFTRALIASGANIDRQTPCGTALGSVQTREIALLLLDAGGDPAHLSFEGRRIAEVGVPHYPRTAGSPTGAKPSVVLRAMRDFWSLRMRLWLRHSEGMGRGEAMLG